MVKLYTVQVFCNKNATGMIREQAITKGIACKRSYKYLKPISTVLRRFERKQEGDYIEL